MMKTGVLIAMTAALTLTAVTGATAQNATPIVTPGTPVTATLVSSDPVLSDGRNYRCYRLRTTAGQSYAIELNSNEFDAYLTVLTGGCGGTQLLTNDDSVGTNAGVMLPGDGNSRYILASGLSQGELGSFTLSVRQFASGRARAQDVGMGGRLSGVLDEADPLTSDAKLYEVYSFTGRAGQMITIDLSSDMFDSYLVLGRQTASGFESIQEDDDGQFNGTNSRISFTPPTTGEYRFKVMGLYPGARGAYTLDIGPGPGFDYEGQARAQAAAEAQQQAAYAQQQAQAQAQANYAAQQERDRQQRIADCRARERAANQERENRAMGNLMSGLVGMAAGDNNYAAQQFAQGSQAQSVNYNCGG